MRPITSAVLALLCAAVGACAASNPDRTNVPAPWTPVPPAKTPVPAEGVAQSAPPAPADATKTAATSKPGAVNARAATKSDDVADARERSERSDPLIARVGDEDVHLSELLGQLLYRRDLPLLDELHTVVMKHFTYLEAERLRVLIDAEKAADAYDEAIQRLEDDIARKSPGMSLDRWVDRVLGLDPIRFRDHARQETRLSLIHERVVRAWILQHERVECRILLVDHESKLKAAQAELADGVAFEEVARKHSLHSSKDQGGLIPPVVARNTAIGQLAFETAVGTIAAPVSSEGSWLLMRVEGRHDPLPGNWSSIGPAVEESLKQRPVEDPEIQQWREAMIDRYPVDERPLFELVHGPAR